MEVKTLIEAYPTSDALLTAFNPQAIRAFSARMSAFLPSGGRLSTLGRIYALDAKMYSRYNPSPSANQQPAPTLATVGRVYQPETAVAWLIIQLADLAEYAGVKDKFTQGQLEEQAYLILSEYWYLRLSELMDFFRLFKLGKFGKFYGIADPLVVTEALVKFKRYRSEVIDELLSKQAEEERERERAERAGHVITYNGYKQLLQAEGKAPESEEFLNQFNHESH